MALLSDTGLAKLRPIALTSLHWIGFIPCIALHSLHCIALATKFHRFESIGLLHLGCNAGSLPQTSEMKIALQQIWTDLSQTPINKAVNDFHKRLQACISAGDGHFEHSL